MFEYAGETEIQAKIDTLLCIFYIYMYIFLTHKAATRISEKLSREKNVYKYS